MHGAPLHVTAATCPLHGEGRTWSYETPGRETLVLVGWAEDEYVLRQKIKEKSRRVAA